MKILIHGRKNGYTILYPKPTPTEFYSFASDIQSISANNYDVFHGKHFYTLAFVESGYIFTKYVIGNDVERGQLGEIGVSVFIPNDKKLSGRDVKTMLDDLVDTYSTNYISDNKIIEPKNGFNWLLFTAFADSYDKKLGPFNDISITAGTEAPAFHYYKSDEELIELLDKPFQEEYSDYKQVLFIDNNLQGAANPLHVINNSGIEVNPDLRNVSYNLKDYNSHTDKVKISAFFNDKWNERSGKKGESQIKANWRIKIEYSKDYYEPVDVEGSVLDLSSSIHDYLKITESTIEIKDNAFKPQEKTFTLYVTSKKNNEKVTGFEINIDKKGWEKETVVTFKGGELGEEHEIAVCKGDELFAEVVKIIPKDLPSNSIRLELIEKKVVKIKVTDRKSGKDISPYKINVKGKKIDKYAKQIEFVGEEIDKKWDIEIKKSKEYNGFNKKFYPATDGNEIHFKLEKKLEPLTKEPANSIFNKVLSKGKYFVIGFLVIAISIVGGLYLFNHGDKEGEPVTHSIESNEIKKYVEGDSLILSKVLDYKKKWKSEEERFILKSGGGFFGGKETTDSTKWKNEWQPTYRSIKDAIDKREVINRMDTAQMRKKHYFPAQNPFKEAIEKIDSSRYRAIHDSLGDISNLTLTEIAEKINNILEPNNVVNDEELNPIDEEQNGDPEYIVDYLIDESEFNLDRINTFYERTGLSKDLNKSLRIVKYFIEGDYKGCASYKNKVQEDKFLKENEYIYSWIDKVCQDGKSKPKPSRSKTGASTETSSQPAQSDEITAKTADEIKKYLIGDIKKAQLNKYKDKSSVNDQFQKKIKLCLKLWKLDGTPGNSYSSYKKELEKDVFFNESKLKKFVDEMCEKERPKYISEIPKIDQNKSLSHIKSKVQQ